MNPNIFNYIKSRIAILEVVNNYTTIKKTGHYWKGACPFHSERTPSFTVSPDKNIFYCFGCHMGGDVITFIAKVENVTPLQAAHYLAEQHSILIPEQLDAYKDQGRMEHQKQYWSLCKLVAQWCHENLLKSPQAMQYLKGRFLTQESIVRFQLGYFPKGARAIKPLLEFIKPYYYLAQDLIEAGIVNEGKAHLYSPFEERIIFPIKDYLGRFSGFGARIFMPNDERSKYYNSKENSFFLKGSMIFGFDLAKQAIQKEDAVFLVEGYMDCIAMVQSGFTNTVATLGTACTIDHLKLLARYAATVYVVYDSDTAGQNALLRLVELCWQVNLELQVIQLPPKEDPASYLQKNQDFKHLMGSACSIFSFYIQHMGRDFAAKSLSEKMRLIHHLLKIILQVEPIKQDFLLQMASKNYGIPFDTLKKELTSNSMVAAGSRPELAPTDTKTSGLNDSLSLKTNSELEKKLFSVIINNAGMLQEEDWHFIDYFHDPLQDILKKIKIIKNEHPSYDFINFFELLSPEQKNLVSKLLVEFQEYTHEKNFAYLFAQFQKQHWKSLMAVFKIKLAKAEQEGNKNLTQKLLQDLQKVKNKFKNI